MEWVVVTGIAFLIVAGLGWYAYGRMTRSDTSAPPLQPPRSATPQPAPPPEPLRSIPPPAPIVPAPQPQKPASAAPVTGKQEADEEISGATGGNRKKQSAPSPGGATGGRRQREEAEPEFGGGAPQEELPNWLAEPDLDLDELAIDPEPEEAESTLPDWLAEQILPEPALAPPPATDEDEEYEAKNEKAESEEAVTVARAQFSAYTPATTEAEQRYALYVYAYSEAHEGATQRDVARFEDALGGEVPRPRVAKQTADVTVGTRLTVVPECPELSFEPESLTKTWHGDWSRFEFEFRPPRATVDETLFVRISIQIAGIEIAHIKSALEVSAPQPAAPASDALQDDLPDNPLALAKLQSQTVTPYQRIFISYSRRDSNIARAYKMAQTALGNDAFLDVDNLRAGEDWRAALARAIDTADIFQLFWSEHSASSEYCRYEWDYAMQARCTEAACEGFIRPVYWRRPMPAPPPELSRINFRFVPFEEQEA